MGIGSLMPADTVRRVGRPTSAYALRAHGCRNRNRPTTVLGRLSGWLNAAVGDADERWPGSPLGPQTVLLVRWSLIQNEGCNEGNTAHSETVRCLLSMCCTLSSSEALEARRLVELRDRWLNPAGMGRVDRRAGPRLSEAAHSARRGRGEGAQEAHTLTNLYNARPQWLVDAHTTLGHATVAAAYGWSADISDDDALRELLVLNGDGR